MTIGGAILLAAIGAILRYAVADSVDGIDLATIGLILIIAGVVGLVLSLVLDFGRRGRRTERTVEHSGEPVQREEIRERY
jgi:uncharacterized protein DUF6458